LLELNQTDKLNSNVKNVEEITNPNFGKAADDSPKMVNTRNKEKAQFASFTKKSQEFVGNGDYKQAMTHQEREKIGKMYAFENVIQGVDTDAKGEGVI
jgi:hypothetical protein